MKAVVNLLATCMLIATASAQSPCEADSVHRQFDFWVGEWNVRNAQGQPVGTSSIGTSSGVV